MEAVADRTGGGGARIPRIFRLDLKWVILGLCVAIVAYLALIPLGFLLWQSLGMPTAF